MRGEGRWWRRANNGVTCLLCPRQCVLPEGTLGLCGIRLGASNGIHLPFWGVQTAAGLDPIEKKPLYHFHPSKPVWSMGFAGCNMQCPFCQNHRISQSFVESGSVVQPQEFALKAKSMGAEMAAFTYSEPGIHAEYLTEAANAVHNQGLSTVMVTNGNINAEPAADILKLMDGVNIDLKSWSSEYYRKTLKGRLETVKEFIQIAREYSWIELTTLIVTDDNEDEKEIRGICEWIAEQSKDIPFHLSGYHPAYRYSKPSTSEKSLAHLAKIARQYLNFVYIGNMNLDNHTRCPECQHIVIRRHGYRIDSCIVDGQCPGCSRVIPGVYSDI